MGLEIFIERISNGWVITVSILDGDILEFYDKKFLESWKDILEYLSDISALVECSMQASNDIVSK